MISSLFFFAVITIIFPPPRRARTRASVPADPSFTEMVDVAHVAMLGEESPSTVMASFDEWPDSMSLPLALVDMADAARKGCHDPSGSTDVQSKPNHSDCASHKAADRHDSPMRPTNCGSSAAAIWGQCLSEWRASNPEAVTPKRAAHTPTVFPKPVARKPKASNPRGRPGLSRPGPRPRAVGEDVALEGPLGLVAPLAGRTKEELKQLVQLVDACAIGGAHCSSCNLWRTLRAADQPTKV